MPILVFVTMFNLLLCQMSLVLCFCFSSEKAQLQATNAIQQPAGAEKREKSSAAIGLVSSLLLLMLVYRVDS